MALNDKKTINCILDEAGVDRISETLREWMEQHKVQEKNVIRCRLAMESLLEDLCVHFDRKLNVSVEMGKRFGATIFVVRYGGEPYDPLKETGTEVWTGQLLSNIGMMPSWSFKRGVNALTLKLPRNKLRSEVWLAAAFAAAVALGALGSVIPDTITSFVGGKVFASISSLFMDLLGTFAGLVVFLSVANGICGVGNVAEFSKKGKYLILRNLATSFLGSGFCAVLMIPFFRFRTGESGGESQLGSVVKMLMQIIPSDPVTPFQTGNMLEIVFMAILVGVVIVILDTKADKVRGVVMQSTGVIMGIVEIICKLLPIYILTSLTQLFWESGMGTFKTIWKPLVLCIVFSMLIMAVKLTIVAIKCKVSVAKLFRKTLPGFIIGLTTASSSAAYGTVMDVNERALGIDRQLSNFGYPIEMIMSVSTLSGGFIAIIYFLAEYEGVPVNPMWFVSAWILITIVSESMPPVSGGALIVLSIMLAQCNIPASCLGIAGTLTLMGDFFMTAARIVICQMELVLEAKHWGTLDLDKLRS